MARQSCLVRWLVTSNVLVSFMQSFALKVNELPQAPVQTVKIAAQAAAANVSVVSQPMSGQMPVGVQTATAAPVAAAMQKPPATQQVAPGQVTTPLQVASVAQPAADIPPSIEQMANSTVLPPVSMVSPVVQHITNVDPSLGSSWRMLQLAHFLEGLTFTMVVKALCIAGNVMVSLSPLPQVKRWANRKCTGEADAAPFVSIAFGGWQWSFYGLFAWFVTGRSGFLVLVHSNCLGAVLGTYYSMTFYYNCRNDGSLDSLQKYLSAVSALVFLQVCGMSVLPAERALFLTGLVSSFCSFIGATSILVTLPQVLRCRDSRSIPGPLAFASLSSNFVWSLCGWLLDDPMVLVPALFAMCCALTALSCKLMYPSAEVSDREGAKELCLVEHGEGQMGKMLLATKLDKAEFSPPGSEFIPIKPKVLDKTEFSPPGSEFIPIKPKVLTHNMVTFAENCHDGTGGTY